MAILWWTMIDEPRLMDWRRFNSTDPLPACRIFYPATLPECRIWSDFGLDLAVEHLTRWIRIIITSNFGRNGPTGDIVRALRFQVIIVGILAIHERTLYLFLLHVSTIDQKSDRSLPCASYRHDTKVRRIRFLTEHMHIDLSDTVCSFDTFSV